MFGVQCGFFVVVVEIEYLVGNVEEWYYQVGDGYDDVVWQVEVSVYVQWIDGGDQFVVIVFVFVVFQLLDFVVLWQDYYVVVGVFMGCIVIEEEDLYWL